MSERTDSVRAVQRITASNNFAITASWVGRIIVLAATGDLDISTTPLLTESLATAAADNPDGIVVDLTEVEFLATAGMSALIRAHRRWASSILVGVVAVGPATARPMKLVGVDDIVAVYPNLEAATRDVAAASTRRAVAVTVT